MHYLVFIALTLHVVATTVHAEDWACESYSSFAVRLLSLGLVDFRRPPSPTSDTGLHTRNELPLGQRPETPVSIFTEVVDTVPDPEFPGRFMHVISPRPIQNTASAPLENMVAFAEMIERYPNFFAPYGITMTRENGQVRIRYPAIEGLNGRIDRMSHSREGALRFWRDLGTSDTDHLRLGRGLAAGENVISANARTEYQGNYHFHDVVVHLHGTLLLPEPVVRSLRARLQMLFEIYDHPRLSTNPALRARLRYMIERQVSDFDESTNLILTALSRMPSRRREDSITSLMFAVGYMGRGNRVLSEELKRDEIYTGLSRGDRNLLDSILSRQWYEPTENNETLARQVLARLEGS